MNVESHVARLIDINSVRHYEGNPRRGNISVIRESLRINGQYRPIVVRTDTDEILAGNHTWDAAKEEGWENIWATFVTCDDETAKRINLIDNRAPELGGYDAESLAAMLGEMPDLDGTGWTSADLEGILAKVEAPEPDHPSGDGGGPGQDQRLGVIIYCRNAQQQVDLFHALQHTKDLGDPSKMVGAMKSVEFEVVTV